MVTDTTIASTFTHHTANVNGVRLHYVMGGKGDAVVLLHGWPVTWYEWHKIMPILAETYTVIAPDMRGFGDSEKPATGYEKRNVAEDIYQLVQKLGFNQINLVGHDIGLMVAYAYAAQHPETVRRLVLMESLLPGFGLEERMDVARGGYWHFGFHMQDIAEKLTEGKERLYIEYQIQGGLYKKEAMTQADLDEYVRCYSAPGGMRGGFAHYRTLLEDGKQNRENFKEKLTMPVLVLGGEHSGIPREWTLAGVHAVAANVREGEVKGSGHFLAEENPADLSRQLRAFFGEEQ